MYLLFKPSARSHRSQYIRLRCIVCEPPPMKLSGLLLYLEWKTVLQTETLWVTHVSPFVSTNFIVCGSWIEHPLHPTLPSWRSRFQFQKAFHHFQSFSRVKQIYKGPALRVIKLIPFSSNCNKWKTYPKMGLLPCSLSPASICKSEGQAVAFKWTMTIGSYQFLLENS